MRSVLAVGLIVVGVALGLFSLAVGTGATSVDVLDDLAGGSAIGWAIGATGMLLVFYGYDRVSGQPPPAR